MDTIDFGDEKKRGTCVLLMFLRFIFATMCGIDVQAVLEIARAIGFLPQLDIGWRSRWLNCAVPDEVQRQLEKQVENLNTARQDLMKQEQEAKDYIVELKEHFETLAKDIGNRRFAMRIDLGTIALGEDVDLHVTKDISDKRSRDIEARAYKVAAAGLVLSANSVELVKSIKAKSAVIDKQVLLSLKLHTKEGCPPGDPHPHRIKLGFYVVGAPLCAERDGGLRGWRGHPPV